jgi:hypothetical protein
VTEIQLTLLAAVHEHPLPAVTLAVPVPLAFENDCVVGEIE